MVLDVTAALDLDHIVATVGLDHRAPPQHVRNALAKALERVVAVELLVPRCADRVWSVGGENYVLEFLAVLGIFGVVPDFG